jgi:aminoglycoside phosphotransferase family enzyme
MRASLASFLQRVFVFRIDEIIKSSASSVALNNHHPVMRDFCLKMWRECHNKLYNIGDLTQQTTFLLEGLTFNRRFSGDVCFGIVPVLLNRFHRMKCGPLNKNPVFENLVLSRPYALVMKRLKEEWRLDKQLQSEKLGSKPGMEFLAHQVASMHKRLDDSLPEFGTPERIAGKLKFNIEQFHEALSKRRANPHRMARSTFSEAEMARIESASILLKQLSEERQHDFEKRHNEKRIKRCHGDLKTSNLWICPLIDKSQAQERFVALDCVDFNPEFCNIDTLSDVAMLAVDLEMRLENVTKSHNEKLSAQQLVRHFIQTYLKAMGENDNVWPILEYYMTEKAIVCAYMSMLYDQSPLLGERYLKVVLAHSQELANVYSSM